MDYLICELKKKAKENLRFCNLIKKKRKQRKKLFMPPEKLIDILGKIFLIKF